MRHITSALNCIGSNQKGGGKIRTGVVGLGYYGSFHAEKYATLPGCELVAVADKNTEKANKSAVALNAQAFTDHRDLIGLVDAVSVVTPTGTHYSVVKDFLKAGIHVLVEKAITKTVEEARELVQLSKVNAVTLQVGHLERFNPTFGALADHLRSPNYIEALRLTRFQKRGDDVNVVLDLMIHDIDLVQALMRSPVAKVQAKGVKVYSNALDLVNAIIHFENGAVANLTASRASVEPQRVIHLFQDHCHTCLDMNQKSVVTQVQDEDGRLEINELQLENEDILRTEVASFLETVRSGSQPVVTGQDGLSALETAIRITEAVEQSLESNEPLPVQDINQVDNGYVTHDCHPETHQPFFSRTSLINHTPYSVFMEKV